MLVHHFLEEAARATPDAPALIEPARTTSYLELDRLANQFARAFATRGLVRGDRVAIAVENGSEMVGAYFGALKAGGVAVPLPAGTRSDRLALAVSDCTPRVAVVDGLTAAAATRDGSLDSVAHVLVVHHSSTVPLTPRFESSSAVVSQCRDEPVAEGRDERDLAAIIYTSGSTGEPRGVMLSHRNFVSNARSIVGYLQLTARDRVMCVLPFHYVYGLSLLHTHLAVGGALVLENRSAFPNVVLAGMRVYETTGFAGVPSTFALMLHRSSLAETTLPALRYVTQAGGGMPPAKILEWLERGPRAEFFVMYGATEAAARLSYLPPVDLRRKIGSIGKPISGVEIDIVDEAGNSLPTGEVGELAARGANISPGYWKNPAETALRFGPRGYLTGDLGYVDDEGYLFLVGRRHDMLKVGGIRVGVKEIEDVLHEHPAVHEAAVAGVHDDLLGEVPVAVVALRSEITNPANELRAFCATRLAAYKVPARVVVQAALPKLAGSGKIDRAQIRALANAADVAANH